MMPTESLWIVAVAGVVLFILYRNGWRLRQQSTLDEIVDQHRAEKEAEKSEQELREIGKKLTEPPDDPIAGKVDPK